MIVFFRRLCAALVLVAAPLAATAEAPSRIVSMNLCSDQLVLMLAPRQHIVSLSFLASDPRSSAMVTEAKGIAQNRGLAEQVYLLEPDLVLAGEDTAQAGVAMLRKLGIKVVQIKTANSMQEIRDNLIVVGQALGQGLAAAAMIQRFDQDLIDITKAISVRPRAAIYSANGYTSGTNSLGSQILAAAGFRNIATELGMDWSGGLALEQLIMAAPDLLITSEKYPGASRSEDILDHPALAGLKASTAKAVISDHNWSCGTPHVIAAIKQLADVRLSLEAL